MVPLARASRWLELAAAVRDEAFKEAGLAAFAYERRWYNAAQANWPVFSPY